jgi:hypothetical protein
LGKKVVFFAHHSHANTSHKVKKVQKKNSTSCSIVHPPEERKEKEEKEGEGRRKHDRPTEVQSRPTASH